MALTFRGGSHVREYKNTRNCPIETMPAPEKVYISMAQHIGAPCKPLVAKGDLVTKGQKIGDNQGLCVPVHASVSGKVKAVEMRPHTNGSTVLSVVIENDHLDTLCETIQPRTQEEVDALTPEQLVDIIHEAGIVGMGGATFPTHVKLSPKTHVDTLIINAAECEPYITCDYRLLLEKTDEFIAGVLLLKKALGAEHVFIGIEKNKPEAIKKLIADCANTDIAVAPCKVKYPQGAEKQLIYAVTRRKVPCGGLPADVGVVVSNVHTAYSVARAVYNGEPSYKRAMTVSGSGVQNPGNFWVRTGTSYQFIYDTLDKDVSLPEKNVKIISGGPMMGFAQPSMRVCTTKGSSSLLFLTEQDVENKPRTQCINCAGCAKVCPMHLMPMKIEAAVLSGDWEDAKKYGVLNCIECGCCAYNCPAKRPLTQAIRLGKKTIKEKKI